MSAIKAMTPKKEKTKKKYDKNTVIFAYLMLTTEIIGFFVFTLYPILWSVRLSWFSYDGVASNTRFVGWTNYINVFTKDTTYWKTLLTTLQFTVLKIPIELSIALFLAVLLTKKLKGSGFFRTMFFMPHVISVAIVGLIFTNMFSFFGIVNNYLVKAGALAGNIDWFAKKNTAMSILVIASIWQTAGINVLYFISALSNVPEELYEAAKIDGAGTWRLFWSVTLPGIAPVFQIILMMSIIGTIHTSDIVLVLTGGAPGGQTYTVMPYLTGTYVPGFADSGVNIGYGCALAVVTAVILAIITLIYNKYSAKLSENM